MLVRSAWVRGAEVAGSRDKSSKAADLNRAIRRCIPGIMVALGFSFVTSLAMLAPTIYMFQLFDRVLTSGSIGTLLGLSLLAALGVILFVCFDYLRGRIYQVIGRWLSRRLSEDIMGAVLSQSLRGKGSPGQTLRDIGEIRAFVAGSALTSGLEFIWSPLFFAVLFLLHPVYGLLGVIGGVILMAIAVANEVMTRAPILEANESGINTFNKIGNALRNAEAIEAMGILPNVIRRWRRDNDHTLEMSERAGTIAGAIRSVSKGVRLVLQMSTFGVGVLLVLTQEASAGSLIAASLLMGRALGPVDELIGGWRQWVSVWDSFRRTVEVAEAHEAAGRSTMPLPRPSGRIEIDRLVFVPPGHTRAVIKGIKLLIEAGETIALIGPSAAGKSTLARLLVGIWPPTGGSIRMDGHDVYHWERESFGRNVGYLPQTVELFEATVRENIARLRDAPAEEVIQAAKQADVHEMIGRLPHGYDTDIAQNAYALTGGQRQRIALARALFGGPALLVLDEPDASLDSDGQEALLRALQEQKAAGATIIVVTHRPQLLRLADRIVVLNDGMIERVARPSDIMTARPPADEQSRPADALARIAR